MLKLITVLFTIWIMTASNIYDFKVPSLDGTSIDFSKYKGKNILIVNTASQCGYTKQYADLEKLYEQHKGNLVIIGFPANNFGGQEPGTNKEIKEFCSKNYGVSFPMAEKISVKGSDTHPLFQYLTSKEKNGQMDADIKWNFTKFLINKEGKLVAVFPSSVNPLSEEITKYLN
jgi:glutathione peroxidase